MRLEIPILAGSLLLASTAAPAEVTRNLELELKGDQGGEKLLVHVVLGFLIYPAEHSLAFSVRNARYD